MVLFRFLVFKRMFFRDSNPGGLGFRFRFLNKVLTWGFEPTTGRSHKQSAVHIANPQSAIAIEEQSGIAFE